MKWIDDVMASQWRTHERDPRYRDAENNPTRLVWPALVTDLWHAIEAFNPRKPRAVEPAAFLDDGGAYRAVFGGESVSVQLHEREFVYIYTAMTPASAGRNTAMGAFFQRIQIFGPDDTEGGLQRVINDGEPEILTVEASGDPTAESYDETRAKVVEWILVPLFAVNEGSRR